MANSPSEFLRRSPNRQTALSASGFKEAPEKEKLGGYSSLSSNWEKSNSETFRYLTLMSNSSPLVTLSGNDKSTATQEDFMATEKFLLFSNLAPSDAGA